MKDEPKEIIVYNNNGVITGKPVVSETVTEEIIPANDGKGTVIRRTRTRVVKIIRRIIKKNP